MEDGQNEKKGEGGTYTSKVTKSLTKDVNRLGKKGVVIKETLHEKLSCKTNDILVESIGASPTPPRLGQEPLSTSRNNILFSLSAL